MHSRKDQLSETVILKNTKQLRSLVIVASCTRMHWQPFKRKFGQPHAIVGAHLGELNFFPPLKMHKPENVISLSSPISGLIAVLKSLSFNDYLKNVSLLNQAVSKLPPNPKEAWSMHTITHNWQRPKHLDFNNWLKEKAEGYERLRVLDSTSKKRGTS